MYAVHALVEGDISKQCACENMLPCLFNGKNRYFYLCDCNDDDNNNQKISFNRLITVRVLIFMWFLDIEAV